jgi:hypothetical protein
MVNGQEHWRVGNVHAKHDKRPETFAKSRSRSGFKNKRIAVILKILYYNENVTYGNVKSFHGIVNL